ncbi:MAG: NADH-quinone oxidoreductase subunit J [Actinobacteria bacterium]|nr:NADH-quinone oxidoreductase subunit J [Actinomycetota bacterium]
MSGLDVLFLGVGLLTAGSALLAVTSRVVLHAALWLVVALGGLAGCYLVLGAELVALVQLLIYVGAVVVLVLVALMLTRQGSVSVSTSRGHRLLAGLVGAGVAVLLGVSLTAVVGWSAVDLRGPSSADIGAQIFGTWVWPFELLSLLLLLALVGAIAVARGAGATEDAAMAAETTGADADPATAATADLEAGP